MKKIVIIVSVALMMLACKKEKSKEVLTPKKEITQKEESQQWIILFDGSSFENWRGYLVEDMYPEWSIEDKAMVFTPNEKGGKNIITKEKFTNFILSLEWKISEGGNSGIFWGVYEDEKYAQPYNTGPEIQVLDNDKHPDAKAKPKYHQAGALYDLVQPKHDVCKPVGEWNTCVIKVDHTKNQGNVTLNGTVIVEFQVHGEKWDAMVANSKFRNSIDFGKYQTGHIGLQDHGDKVWYRNVKLKKL